MKKLYLSLQLQGQKVDIIFDDGEEIHNAKIVGENDFYEIEDEEGRTVYINKVKVKKIIPKS